MPPHHRHRGHPHRPGAGLGRRPPAGRSWSRARPTSRRSRARSQAVGRDDLACIIYTSGTGGAPRGVQQHHGAILHNVEGCTDIISTDFGWDDEVFLSFLPASHAYEHTGGQHFPIALGAQIYYAESLEKLAANIEEVQPTIMVVVPRLFEMLRARIMKTHRRQRRAVAISAQARAEDRRRQIWRARSSRGTCRWTASCR